MNEKINHLDKTLFALNTLTHNREYTTIPDINNLVKIKEEDIGNIILYLKSLNYIDQKGNSDSFRITFEGQLFLSKSNFLYSKKPFLYEKRYKDLKFLVLFLNSCLVLGIGIYGILKKEQKKDKQQIEIICKHLEKNEQIKMLKMDSLKK